MKLFNARLIITNVIPKTANTWDIEGNVIDNYGQFIATHAQVNDVIFNNALNETTMEYNVCKYFITNIDSKTNGSFIACTIQWDEEYNTVADISVPIPGEEASIGTAIEVSDFSALPPNSQGVSVSFLELASNIEKVQHTKNNNKKFSDLTAKDVELQNLANSKADLTYVNTELAKKSDLTYVNDELAKKANITDVALKADTTYVNDELAKKADLTYVNTELAKKATTDEVALKADTAYVNTELAKKADATHNHNDLYHTKLEVNTFLSNKSDTGHTHIPGSIVTNSENRFVTDAEKATWNGKQDALGFTPENITNKGVANGYASLDNNGKVPVSQIPSSFKEIEVVNTIALRDAITDLFSGKVVHVVDATGDSTVTSGWAEYIYNGTAWVKTIEQESLDVVLDWANIQNKPTTFTPSAHTHLGSEVTSAVAEATHAVNADNVSWAGVAGTPTTIAGYGITDAADKVHTHLGSEVTSAVAEATHAVNADSIDWTGVKNKPTTLAGYGITDGIGVHTHVKADITDFSHTHLGSEITGTVPNATHAGSADSVEWSGVLSKPTTLAGYGITDAADKVHTHVKANITDLVNATQTESGLLSNLDKVKLDSIEANANNYIHPASHAATIITTDESRRFVSDTQIATWDGKQNALGFTPENVTNKGVANGYASLDSNGMVPISQIPASFKEVKVVNTIAERDALTDLFSGKVVHVVDATADSTVTSGWAEYIYNGTAWIKTTEKESLDIVLEWANIQNKPTTFTPSAHTHLGSEITSAVAEATHAINADKVDWAGVQNKPTTLAGYGITDAIGAHTHVKANITDLANATQTESGLLSNTDKVKLDGIETNANNYVHPDNHAASIILQDMNNRFVTDTEKATWNGKQDALGFTPENVANKNSANGYVGLDSNSKIAESQIPTSFKEISVVANIASRDAITDLFAGKTVYVVDATADSNVASGWAEYIYTGSAWQLKVKGENSNLTLEWTNILNKPTTFAPSAHNHDDLYNTKAEITSALATKANSTHTHLGSEITSAVAEATHAVSADSVEWSGVTNKPASFTPSVHTHVKANITDLVNVTTTESGLMSNTDKTKLDGIETNANNYIHPASHNASMITTDATHRFVTDTQTATWDGKQNALGFTPENTTNKGVANGYASLDGNGVIPVSQIPASFKEVKVVNTIAERNALTDLFSGKVAHVVDATGDSTVTSGWAEYIYNGTAWIKTTEQESLDVVLDWANIQNKPASFTATSHTHLGSEVTSAVAEATHAVSADNATTAGKLTTARDISLTGDVTATAVSFDGSANASLTTVLSNTGVTAGTYNSANLTVDSKGRITNVTNGISTMDYEPSGSTNKDVWIRATGPGVSVVKADVGGFYRATFTVPADVKILSLKVRFLAAEVTSAAKVQIDWNPSGSTDYVDFMPPISQCYIDTTGNRTTSAKPVNYNINAHTAEVTGLTASAQFSVRLIF